MAPINTDMSVSYLSLTSDLARVQADLSRENQIKAANQERGNSTKGKQVNETSRTGQSVVAQAAQSLAIADRTHGWVFKEKNLNGRDYVLERPPKKIPVSQQHVPAGLGIQELRRPKIRRVGL
jgi:hypothetical protein